MNPCKCGYYPDRTRCNCSEGEVKKYMRRISRPLLDRIDISVEAPPVKYTDLEPKGSSESSAQIRERVAKAWEVQRERFASSMTHFNSEMTNAEIKEFCAVSEEDKSFLETAFNKMNLSARGYMRVLKVSRTIADLSGSPEIRREHIFEALSYRNAEEKIWGN